MANDGALYVLEPQNKKAEFCAANKVYRDRLVWKVWGTGVLIFAIEEEEDEKGTLVCSTEIVATVCVHEKGKE